MSLNNRRQHKTNRTVSRSMIHALSSTRLYLRNTALASLCLAKSLRLRSKNYLQHNRGRCSMRFASKMSRKRLASGHLGLLPLRRGFEEINACNNRQSDIFKWFTKWNRVMQRSSVSFSSMPPQAELRTSVWSSSNNTSLSLRPRKCR